MSNMCMYYLKYVLMFFCCVFFIDNDVINGIIKWNSVFY